jgi:hypothetical protein
LALVVLMRGLVEGVPGMKLERERRGIRKNLLYLSLIQGSNGFGVEAEDGLGLLECSGDVEEHLSSSLR